MKPKKKIKIRKDTKKKRIVRKTKPRNAWNSLRKLENYLKKADIQANIFMDSLNEIRDTLSFEIKAEIVKKLCNSVNGDLLSALLEHKKNVEEKGRFEGENQEANSIILGIYDALVSVLNLSPHKREGEKFFVTRESAREYDFDEHPEALDDERIQKFQVEVLRCGWKLGEKVVVKPKVFEFR